VIGISRKAVFSLLSNITTGKLILLENGQRFEFGKISAHFPSPATIRVSNPRFYQCCLTGGSVGAAEAYLAGYWTTDNLVNVIRIILRSQAVFSRFDKGWARLSEPFHKIFHFFRKNTLGGSRENILAHYDLGNEFYSLFLDSTFTYSCGVFENPENSLENAAVSKYDRICRKIDLGPKDHVLEIGTGWGGFAIHAAQHYGCRVTTTTISDQQHDFAAKRIAEYGLRNRIALLKKDYRHLKGTFDKLVSIEMIEAVGHQYLKEFFRCCGMRLKPEGIMALQAITILDSAYEQHKNSVDFIKRYIFPGSCIPSVTALCDAMAATTDLRLFHLEDITAHYAVTLRKWRENFLNRLDQVKRLGYSDTFIRMWEFYFCYCEAGFGERYLGDCQMIFTKPLWRPSSQAA
jgi:cyclopropane-fatty-acyl-phospholipid synthase